MGGEMWRGLAVGLSAVVLTGCTSLGQQRPASLGETESGYTYIPLDPLPVVTLQGNSCGGYSSELLGFDKETQKIVPKSNLEALPDNAVRIGIQSFTADGGVEFGVGSATGNQGLYKITVDYVNVDTVNVSLSIYRLDQSPSGFAKRVPYVQSLPSQGAIYVDRDYYDDLRPIEDDYGQVIDDRADLANEIKPTIYNIPVFVGVGVRIIADVKTNEAGVDITGLGVIGGNANLKNLSGTMVAQTLGINGKDIAAAMPIQSSLDSTSVENALVAIGSVKTLIYADGTSITPRVVGMYLPFPASRQLVNSIVSQLSNRPIPWNRECKIVSIEDEGEDVIARGRTDD